MVEEEPWVTDLVTVSTTVAYTITRNYKGYAEVDDVKQELLEWSLKRADKIQEWLSPELSKQEYRLGIKRLAKTFNRMADRYCRREKARKLGYYVHDEALRNIFLSTRKRVIIRTFVGHRSKTNYRLKPESKEPYVIHQFTRKQLNPYNIPLTIIKDEATKSKKYNVGGIIRRMKILDFGLRDD